ncbi:MAG TPA: DNA-binding response regulator [Deltaproteobacteria bacterium]|nr:DNA-binding response regulator [Deltaproteobacteria bacterium]
MATRVLLADDHRIIREGLRSLLQKQSDMEVAEEAEDGITAVRLAEKLHPDIVIMDIGMPDLNGIEATRQIISRAKGIKVIALSMHSDKRFVLEMLKAGASGYLLKDCAFEELINAIRTVRSGQIYLSNRVTGVVVDECLHHRPTSDVSAYNLLTAREREVLQLLAEGNSTKSIAVSLNVSTKTIETHRQQIMEKLDLHSVAELTKYAIKEGLTSLDP